MRVSGKAYGSPVGIGSSSVVRLGRSSAVCTTTGFRGSVACVGLFDGATGLVNVDLTPETAVRLAAALGTALRRGSRLVASRA